MLVRMGWEGSTSKKTHAQPGLTNPSFSPEHPWPPLLCRETAEKLC